MRPKTPWIVCALCVLVTSSCEEPVDPIQGLRHRYPVDQ